MDLALYAGSLRPEYATLECWAVKFRHLTDKAQRAVRGVGRAVIWLDGGYNAVYPPK